MNEVTETLQKFLDIKNEKKESTIESILLVIVWDLIQQNNEKGKIASKDIWEELISEVPGKIDEKKPNEYHSDDYGTIYRNATLATYLGDSFGGVVKHTNKGNVWIFDTETIESMIKDDKTKIIVNEIKEEEKVKAVNTMNTPDIEGSKNLQKNNEEEEQIQQGENPDPSLQLCCGEEQENTNSINKEIPSENFSGIKENNYKNIENSDTPPSSDAFNAFTAFTYSSN